MSSERYNQIVNEAYDNYLFNSEWFPISSVSGGFIGTKATGEIMTENLFINKIKTDSEFSEKWGLKIEERDLTMREQEMLGHNYGHLTWEEQANFHFEPTKLITMTYNNETIEIYE
jgi:hypothetical protein